MLLPDAFFGVKLTEHILDVSFFKETIHIGLDMERGKLTAQNNRTANCAHQLGAVR